MNTTNVLMIGAILTLITAFGVIYFLEKSDNPKKRLR